MVHMLSPQFRLSAFPPPLTESEKIQLTFCFAKPVNVSDSAGGDSDGDVV